MNSYQAFNATSAVALKLLANDTNAVARPIEVEPYVIMISESLWLKMPLLWWLRPWGA